MFTVFIFLVYFTFLWMLLVRDEPVIIAQQEKTNLREASLDKPSKVAKQTFISSIHSISAPTTLASSKRGTEDLEMLGIRELRQLSRGRVRGFMRLTKAELVQALQ